LSPDEPLSLLLLPLLVPLLLLEPLPLLLLPLLVPLLLLLLVSVSLPLSEGTPAALRAASSAALRSAMMRGICRKGHTSTHKHAPAASAQHSTCPLGANAWLQEPDHHTPPPPHTPNTHTHTHKETHKAPLCTVRAGGP
jgi:hypothetical protein